jgi:hypothetical protein
MGLCLCAVLYNKGYSLIILNSPPQKNSGQSCSEPISEKKNAYGPWILTCTGIKYLWVLGFEIC